jgi:hypothetical protein
MLGILGFKNYQILVWEPEFSFFCSKPQNSTKTGSLKFGNK